MKIPYSLLFLLFFLRAPTILHAQVDTSKTPKVSFLQKSIIPATLIVGGSLLSGHQIEKDFSTSFKFVKPYTIEDYLQFIPIGEMYIADILQIESKNHWFDQSKYLALSGILDVVLVLSIKQLTQKTRPNGHGLSFPSGHTSFAFMGATVLYEEFKETRPFFAYSGYGFATATGILRITNRKHWLSDVLVGAGIGILSTRLIYHLEPLKKWNPFLSNKHISITPSFHNGVALRLKIGIAS